MVRFLGFVLVMAGMLGVTVTGPAEAAGPVTVQLTPQSNSGESGTATLSEQGPKTKVVVAVNGQPAGVPQPLHIHKGTCVQLDPKPAYGLATLTNGKSETTVDVPLATLQAGGFAINGHKSAQDVKTYVLCGNIPAQ
jgi:Cu/Zn superoxide dismutase